MTKLAVSDGTGGQMRLGFCWGTATRPEDGENEVRISVKPITYSGFNPIT